MSTGAMLLKVYPENFNMSLPLQQLPVQEDTGCLLPRVSDTMDALDTNRCHIGFLRCIRLKL